MAAPQRAATVAVVQRVPHRYPVRAALLADAALGAILLLVVHVAAPMPGLFALTALGLPWAALAGAWGGFGLVLLLSHEWQGRRRGALHPVRLALVGVAVAAALGAAQQLILVRAPDGLGSALSFLTGSVYGADAARPRHTFLRLWGVDPYTLGYTTHWWPGDVMRVGPLHGTHDPPFYVCGSDQWAAGYMEGAVRTGRAAAHAALGKGSWTAP